MDHSEGVFRDEAVLLQLTGCDQLSTFEQHALLGRDALYIFGKDGLSNLKTVSNMATAAENLHWMLVGTIKMCSNLTTLPLVFPRTPATQSMVKQYSLMIAVTCVTQSGRVSTHLG